MLLKKIILSVYCLAIILLCTIVVPWQGNFELQNRHTKVFMGYESIFNEPNFTHYSEDMKSDIMIRLGHKELNRFNLFRYVTASFQIDYGRLIIEIFVLSIITALAIYLFSGRYGKERR